MRLTEGGGASPRLPPSERGVARVRRSSDGGADGRIRGQQGVPARQVAVRSGGGDDDPHRADDRLGGQTALSLRRGVHRPVPLRPAALLVPAARLHRRLRLRRAGPAGGQLPLAVRRPRPPRRLLRPRLDPRVRALRDRGRRRRRRRHRDPPRPRRPQDPRGARRPAGAGRRPDQEPGRPALPGADADHRPARHLRPGLRDQRRHPHRDALPPAARRLLRHALLQRLDHRPRRLGDQVHAVRSADRRRLLLQRDDRLRRRRRRRPRRQRGRRHLLHGRLRLQLRLHPDHARHQPGAADDPMNAWLAVPRGWLDSFGEIARFGARLAGLVYSGRVLRFFGESLRQAGILILGSALIIWALVFPLGLRCGIEGAYLLRAQGPPAYAGVFSAWCDLREIMPYAFGYMMSAKIGTGLVAEIGAMRISDEIDALEVMGINSLVYLCATRLLAAWMVLPFMYIAAVGAGFFASYLAVVQQIGEVSSGGFFLIFWMFQNPPDLLYSVIKGMVMATAIVLVGCYYGYNAGGGPVGVGTATAKSMVVNIVLVHLIGMLGTQVFWGANPRAPIGG